MKSLIIFLFILSGTAAHACPTFSGNWQCVNTQNARDILPFKASNTTGATTVTVLKGYTVDLEISAGEHPQDEYFSYSVTCDESTATLDINGLPRTHMPIKMIYKLTAVGNDHAVLETTGSPTISIYNPGKSYSCIKTGVNAL